MAPTNINPIVNDEEKQEVKEFKRSISNHVLVPAHRLLSDEDKQKLFDKFKIRVKQLPKISIKDPMVKLINDVKAGDVLEIKRSSVTAGEAIYYRVVINV